MPMPGRNLIQSPLVGRDDVLALSARHLAAVAEGSGRMLFVAGEAGIGKTRLLGAITQQAQLMNFEVLRAGSFPGDVQSCAGLLLDLAGDLIACPKPPLRELGGRLSARLRSSDSHRRRRLLIQDLVDLLLTGICGDRLLIVLEDLHWADDVSLDLLGHLATRLAGRPILVAAAYRSDELYPHRPIRDLRTRLLGQRLAEEIQLPRLGLEQTATMIGTLLGRPAPAQVVRALHERSDGIPLHLEEFLATVDDAALTSQSGAGVQAATVPGTLSDAALHRTATLSPRTREVAAAASVIGRSFGFDLLTAITQAEPSEVAAALRELKQAHLILPGLDAATFDFQHAVIRDALYADTDLPVRRHLHERVARSATERGVTARTRPRAAAIQIIEESRAPAAGVGAVVLVEAVQPWRPLSAREFEVAQLVAAGLTNRQIAERLVLAPKTISAHVEHILMKLGAARRAEIAAWCATASASVGQLGRE
jgi:predicted ATPase